MSKLERWAVVIGASVAIVAAIGLSVALDDTQETREAAAAAAAALEAADTVIIDRHIALDCRGVDPDTCRAVGEVAAAELPLGADISRAVLAPAQDCFGQSPCTSRPPDCHVYASVLFDTRVPHGVVIDVIVIYDVVAQVSHWTGAVEAGDDPIRDHVGGMCPTPSASPDGL